MGKLYAETCPNTINLIEMFISIYIDNGERPVMEELPVLHWTGRFELAQNIHVSHILPK